MAIEKVKHLYEVLVRFDNVGKYKASHVIDMQRVTDTDSGEVLAEREEPARPITKAELGPILGAANAGLLEAIETGKARAEAAEAERDAARAELAEALAAAGAARAELEATAGTLRAELDQARARLAAIAAAMGGAA